MPLYTKQSSACDLTPRSLRVCDAKMLVVPPLFQVVLGLTHGLVLLPVLLTVFGPKGNKGTPSPDPEAATTAAHQDTTDMEPVDHGLYSPGDDGGDNDDGHGAGADGLDTQPQGRPTEASMSQRPGDDATLFVNAVSNPSERPAPPPSPRAVDAAPLPSSTPSNGAGATGGDPVVEGVDGEEVATGHPYVGGDAADGEVVSSRVLGEGAYVPSRVDGAPDSPPPGVVPASSHDNRSDDPVASNSAARGAERVVAEEEGVAVAYGTGQAGQV